LGRVVVTGSLALAGYWKDVEFLRSFRPYKYPGIQFNLLDDLDLDDNALLIRRKYVGPIEGYDGGTIMFFTVPLIPLILMIVSFIIALIQPAGGFLTMIIGVTIGAVLGLGLIDALIFMIEWVSRAEYIRKFKSKLANKCADGIEYGIKHNIWKYLGYALAGVLGLLITVACIKLEVLGIVGIPLLLLLISFIYGDKMLEKVNMSYTVAPAKNDYTEIRELLCPKDELNLKPDISYIPPKQRTVRLWYLDLKNKVCKPMQQ